MRTLADCFALFDDATWPNRPALLLSEPIGEIAAGSSGEADAALNEIESAAASGLTAAGYVSYELGYLFERRLAPLLPKIGRPLLRFLLFAKSEQLDASKRSALLARAAPARLGDMAPSLGRASFHERIERIRQLIADGDVYQVNFTQKLRATIEGDALGLFADLRTRSRAGAAAFLRYPDEDIASLSPEQFFTISDGQIAARPMKGTCPRAPDWRSDQARKFELKNDAKQRAENLMIVDLLRNDIARVARVGSVKVDDLLTVETYPRFHTMTSGISAALRDGVGLSQVVRSLFPCGSVTGAPKIRAMEIIRELEDGPRGVYCGAIGFIDKRRAAFNVAIRTLTLRDGTAEMGVGGGIVWDSKPEEEYAEALLKARFATEQWKGDFHLIETMRWTPQEGFFLFARHMERLRRSARYFGFVHDRRAVRDCLLAAIAGKQTTQRVRLTLAADGSADVTTAEFTPTPADAAWPFAISGQGTNSRDPIFHHKTSERTIYDGEWRRLHDSDGVDEVVFLNERGEVTEGSRSTVFVERDGRWLTPPLACGVLDGCLRRELIERGDLPIEEQILREGDLRSGSVWFGNALRGLIKGELAIGPIASSAARQTDASAEAEPRQK